MRSLSGFLVLTAGLGVGAFAYYPTTYDHGDHFTGVVTVAGHRAAPSTEAAQVPRTRLFSPSSPLIVLENPDRLAHIDMPHAASWSPQPAPMKDADAWTVVVTPAPTAYPRLTSSNPADEASRYKLIRDLQRELRRVGCYEGEIDGDWGPMSKRAITTFTARVNASLPTDKPDYILLTLVQRHDQPVCGVNCPSGQSLAGNGRCVPSTIIAQATRHKLGKSAPADSLAATASRKPVRMALAVADIPQPQPATVAATGIPPTVVGPSRPDRPGSAYTEPTLPPPAPLPGRMAIGGPQPEPVLIAPPAFAQRPAASAAPQLMGTPSSADAADPPAPEDLPQVKSVRAAEEADVSSSAQPRSATKSRQMRRTGDGVRPPPKKVYAGTSNRGGVRPGTPRYNLMLSLGGVF